MIDEKVLIAEIERQKSRLKPFVGIGSNVCGRIIKYFDALLVFTNSLQEEPVSEDLEEEIKMYCNKNGYTSTDDGMVYTLNEQIVNTARHFAEWGKIHSAHINEDLEVEAKRLFGDCKTRKGAFKLGANWQLSKMMKDAVEGKVEGIGYFASGGGLSYKTATISVIGNFNKGDKVKLINVEED